MKILICGFLLFLVHWLWHFLQCWVRLCFRESMISVGYLCHSSVAAQLIIFQCRTM